MLLTADSLLQPTSSSTLDLPRSARLLTRLHTQVVSNRHLADAALEVADPRHLAVYDLFLAAGSYALPFLAVPDFLAVAVICSRLKMKRAKKGTG